MNTKIALTAALLAFAAASHAQANKKMTVDEALAAYDFPLAQQLLNAEITRLKRKRQSTDELEAQLLGAQRAEAMMNSVERVVFFDSVAVPKDKVLSCLSLSQESGTICPTAEYEGLGSAGEGTTLFRPQIADKLYFAARGSNGVPQLFSGDLLPGEPIQPKPLAGLDEDPDTPHNYPYMMADGLTLYFAAQGEGSLGGYDIFMARYDPDSHRFYTPENIGMPFNSPANDFLYCVDEAYNIGCFVTDRNMPGDSLCVYYFIPGTVRRTYFQEEEGAERMQQLARLSDIRLTWGTETEVKVALTNLRECMAEKQAVAEPDFTFIVADNHVCHSLNDFRNAKARELAQRWQQDQSVLSQWKASLAQLRLEYANATTAQRQALAPQILKLEGQTESLIDDLRAQETAMRKAELGL